MIELAALGLLLEQPLHGYRLKRQLESFMSSCISVNYGTIYPLLRRLEARGAIAVVQEEAREGGSGRKVYNITTEGRLLWRQEMMHHPQESWVNARSRFIIKYFFFSYLESPERIKLLNHRLLVCQLKLESQEMEPPQKDFYQADVWQQCVKVIQAEIDWLRDRLLKEQSR